MAKEKFYKTTKNISVDSLEISSISEKKAISMRMTLIASSKAYKIHS